MLGLVKGRALRVDLFKIGAGQGSHKTRSFWGGVGWLRPDVQGTGIRGSLLWKSIIVIVLSLYLSLPSLLHI